MRSKNIPFGYCFSNGSVVINDDEKEIVIEICNMYLSGKSLLQIAEALNERKIEYLPRIIGWNKARIKRIIEDERYLGNDMFQQIISTETYEALQRLKTNRNTQTDVNRQNDIYKINTPVICPKCGCAMKRATDRSQKIKYKWNCSNSKCRLTIPKSSAELIADITDLLNNVVLSPNRIKINSNNQKSSNELRKLENEIGRALDTIDFDKEILQKKIFERASLKHEETCSEKYISIKLRNLFASKSLFTKFPLDFFTKTVKEILLQTDGTVHLKLINNQII